MLKLHSVTVNSIHMNVLWEKLNTLNDLKSNFVDFYRGYNMSNEVKIAKILWSAKDDQFLVWNWPQNRESLKQPRQNSSVVTHLKQGIKLRNIGIALPSPTCSMTKILSDKSESIEMFQRVIYWQPFQWKICIIFSQFHIKSSYQL